MRFLVAAASQELKDVFGPKVNTSEPVAFEITFPDGIGTETRFAEGKVLHCDADSKELTVIVNCEKAPTITKQRPAHSNH